MGFMGYRRPDGSVGVRNHVVVMSTVACANGVVNAIGRELPEVKTITHTEGCGRGPADIGISNRTLSGLVKNPNVAAALLVGLGCEFLKAPGIAEAGAATGKTVESLVIQESGGSRKATLKGVEKVAAMLEEASDMEREECDWSELVVGLECGGSDAMSGVTANPMVGATADWLVGKGGSVILSETTEMSGTAEILAKRASSAEVADTIRALLDRHDKTMENNLGPFKKAAISPGNMDGGLTTILEKSLGCIIKGGATPINEVVEYAAAPSERGLIIMDTPGSDIFSMTGMVAGGAQVVIFTTGRGTPAGFPIAPVIKVATNSELFSNMNDDMDINAGRILEGETIEDVSKDLDELLKNVSEGKRTKAEINRQEMLSIQTVGPAF